MANPRGYSPEQIITYMREVEVFLNQKKTAVEACKFLEIEVQTYYHWRRQYGNMDNIQNKKLKEIEKENYRLNQLVADLLADNGFIPVGLQHE